MKQPPSALPDWRLEFAAEVASVESEQSQGPAKGDVVILMARVRTKEDGTIIVPFVSSYRLSLHAALKSAETATDLRKLLTFSGRRGVDKERTLTSPVSDLFDFFEASMGAVIFSFQALESYANQVIAEGFGEHGKFTIDRRRGPVTLGTQDLQRDLSTEEKYAVVLPHLFSVELARSGKIWSGFKRLKKVRDAVIHLKSHDGHPRGGVLDEQSLYYHLLNQAPKSFPRTALDLISHFLGDSPPTWIGIARSRLRSSPGKTGQV